MAVHLAVSLLLFASAAEFELSSPRGTATVLVLPGEPQCVRLAAADLAADVEKITGRKPAIVDRLEAAAPDCVLLLSADRPASAELLERLLPNAAAELRDKWEAFRVESAAVEAGPIRRALVVAGSDERGTMFGLYAFAEQFLGVDPLYLWTDRSPPRRERLAWPSVRLAAGEPTFRYRGWFINDEDLLTEWHEGGGRRDIDYPYYHRVIGPAVAERIFESMLRLQMNLVIPASFVDVRNPAEARLIEAATRRGLMVSMHHVEPMGVSGFGFKNFWRDRNEDVPFSFARRPEKFREIWTDYAARWAKYPGVVWQLGLRGIADRPVWVSDPAAPQSEEARGKLISDAIAAQWEIVRKADRRKDPPATVTLWMEGAGLHRKGLLKFPPGAIVVFSDNSPGWQLQSDFYELPREPGRKYGVYYHHQLWGSGPHLVQAVSPQKTYSIFRQAVERGSNEYAILNVGNVREFVLGLDGTARLLRDFAAYDPDRFLQQWCEARFGPAAAEAEACYRRLFASFVADSKTGARAMLDGEIIQSGQRFYKALLQRADAPKNEAWQKPEEVRSLLRKIEKQRAAAEEAGSGAADVLARLAGEQRTPFEVNFVAQHKILCGLLRWVEHGLRAGLALQEGDRAKVLAELKLSRAGLDEVRAGQALASRGPWHHWYRGDRKMNLSAAEQLTRQASERFR